ncbi:2-oxo acid dehydrogenase subunit E2 [Paenibacillus sp. RC84]|uniref:2-oxo acid dehydrogenase subunit E2 n=1 Tax=Paenibacillus sp. RC84 TaxID=3156252 RepID=UPI0035142EBC
MTSALVKSKHRAPHVTLMDEVDVRQLAALRTKTKPFADSDKKQMLTILKANTCGAAAAKVVCLLKQSHAEACIIETTDKQKPDRLCSFEAFRLLSRREAADRGLTASA